MTVAPRTAALTEALANFESAHCPCCERRVDGFDNIQAVFGTRKVKRGGKIVRIIVQSYCRRCRAKKAQEARRLRVETAEIQNWMFERFHAA